MAQETKPKNTSHLSDLLKHGQQIDLFEGALAIAADRYPNLDTSRYRAEIDSIALKVRESARCAQGARDTLVAINSVLFDELRFTGNTGNYFDPRNSYINQVLDRRTGIPISLSVIYIEVARRAGLLLSGVGMPFHFLVKAFGERKEIFIDPFNGGALMDASECESLLASLSGGRFQLLPEHLAEVTTAQILIRMLANLVSIYQKRLDYAEALENIDRILLIDPRSASHIRDRASILVAQGKLGSAVHDYQRYLGLAPHAQDSEAIRKRLKELRRELAQSN